MHICPIFHTAWPQREAVGVQYLKILDIWSTSNKSKNNYPDLYIDLNLCALRRLISTQVTAQCGPINTRAKASVYCKVRF